MGFKNAGVRRRRALGDTRKPRLLFQFRQSGICGHFRARQGSLSHTRLGRRGDRSRSNRSIITKMPAFLGRFQDARSESSGRDKDFYRMSWFGMGPVTAAGVLTVLGMLWAANKDTDHDVRSCRAGAKQWWKGQWRGKDHRHGLRCGDAGDEKGPRPSVLSAGAQYKGTRRHEQCASFPVALPAKTGS